MSRKNVLCLALAVCLLTSLPVVATAAEVNKNLASNPAAVLNEINSMNLPSMPDEMAAELRGKFIITAAQGAAWGLRVGLNQVAKYYGWNVRFTWFAPLTAWSY